jgi:hypothetical protein
MQYLLAVDLGVKTGLALFNEEGMLIWYRSHNYGNKNRLKKHIPDIINAIPSLSVIVIEGGGDIAELWKDKAKKHRTEVVQIFAEDWRKDLFYDRQFRKGEIAKQNAIQMANKIITESGLKRQKTSMHDTAEAILIGLWGVRKFFQKTI